TLRKDMPDTRINFVAHSMGNLVLLRALERIAERGDSAARKAFGEVILAHADVDAARCRQLVRNVKGIARGLTLYTNANDWALWASEKIRGKSRCGGPAQVYDGVDTIETTELGETSNFWAIIRQSYNHNVFATNALLFGEISRLIATGQRPPHMRTPELAQVKDEEGKIYWSYDPSRNISVQSLAEAN
ncbi:MAG: alpha/beta hydrolase, partial [Pseudomonadota bacterium]